MSPVPDLLLELALPPDARPKRRPGRGRSEIWRLHDTSDGMLAAAGLAVLDIAGSPPIWRLLRIFPTERQQVWLPGAPAILLAEAIDLPGLAHQPGVALPHALVPILRLDVRLQTLAGYQGAQLVVATADGGTTFRRVRLSGDIAATATSLGAALGASLPAHTLCAEALGITAARRQGPPLLPADVTVGDGFAHIVATLADTMIAVAPAASNGIGAEPVHQMRVALRRLRSALSLFGPILPCPELVKLGQDAKRLAGALGPARAWDVFLADILPPLAAALPDNPSVTELRDAAEAQRAAAYAALHQVLDDPKFPAFGLDLALLAATRPWAAEADAQPMAHFAHAALARRQKQLRKRGRHLRRLDINGLHAIRLSAKRLRYTAEFFASADPSHNVARSLRQLAKLQTALGTLNDAATVDCLLAEMPASIGLGYPGGLLRGFIAGSQAGTRDAITQAWQRLRKHKLAWDGS